MSQTYDDVYFTTKINIKTFAKTHKFVLHCPKCDAGYEPLVPCGEIREDKIKELTVKSLSSCSACVQGTSYQPFNESSEKCSQCPTTNDPNKVISCLPDLKPTDDCKPGFFMDTNKDCLKCCPGCHYTWHDESRLKACASYVDVS